jgi:predicted RNase H-like nuclease (RuvC/YqgF family)
MKQIDQKFKTINEKIKTSFALIRKELDESAIIVDAIKKFIKKKDKEHERKAIQHIKNQKKLQKQFDDLEEKLTELNLGLSQLSTIKSEIVLKRHLAQIEDRIKTSFRHDIEKYKEQTEKLQNQLKEQNKKITALEKGKIQQTKKKWFSRN